MAGLVSNAIIFGLLALILSYTVPWASRYPVLLGLTRVWQPDPQFSQMGRTCQSLHSEHLIGCEKFKILGNTLFAACINNWDARQKWFPPMGRYDRSIAPPGSLRDHLYALNLETKELVQLELLKFPSETDFVVHGMDVIETEPGKLAMFIVNHRREGSVVETFSYNVNETGILYRQTLDGAAVGLNNPNDVFAVPVSNSSPASEHAFFVTNDRYFRDFLLGRTLEDFLRLPTGSVFYHSNSSGFKKVLGRLSSPNGITGFQSEQIKFLDPGIRNTIFVASIMNGVVNAFRYESGPTDIATRGKLDRIHKFSFDFVMDNLALSKDGKWLYVTGHGEPLNLERHWSAPNHFPSAAISYRVSLVELQGGFFGTSGEIGESRVEKIVVDRQGKLQNATTTSVADDDRNKFWMSGLTSRGILECDLHNHQSDEEDEQD